MQTDHETVLCWRISVGAALQFLAVVPADPFYFVRVIDLDCTGSWQLCAFHKSCVFESCRQHVFQCFVIGQSSCSVSPFQQAGLIKSCWLTAAAVEKVKEQSKCSWTTCKTKQKNYPPFKTACLKMADKTPVTSFLSGCCMFDWQQAGRLQSWSVGFTIVCPANCVKRVFLLWTSQQFWRPMHTKYLLSFS